jgi:urea transport system permease protein
VLIERSVIRFLYCRPLETLLATWGVSLILQQAVRTIFGPNNREVGNPGFMSGSFDLFGIALTWSRLWIVVFALSVFVTLLLALKFTAFGLRMRAVVQNRRMAASMGIRTNRIDAMTFGLGSGIAGVAGVALSQIDNVSAQSRQSYIIDSFMVVVFGGVGNLWGTLVGALTLGVANKLLEPFAGAVLGRSSSSSSSSSSSRSGPRGLFALQGPGGWSMSGVARRAPFPAGGEGVGVAGRARPDAVRRCRGGQSHAVFALYATPHTRSVWSAESDLPAGEAGAP